MASKLIRILERVSGLIPLTVVATILYYWIENQPVTKLQDNSKQLIQQLNSVPFANPSSGEEKDKDE